MRNTHEDGDVEGSTWAVTHIFLSMLCLSAPAALVIMMLMKFLMMPMEFLRVVIGFRRRVRTSILPVEPKGEGT
jgi:hypothetical protein